MLSPLKFEKGICLLEDFPVPHFFTTTHSGNLSSAHGDSREAERNFNFILRAKNAPLSVKAVTISPEHSDKILFASPYFAKSRDLECDGLLTFLSGVSLVLKPADCLPVLMTALDHEGKPRFIGLIHAGRQETNLEISRKAVELACAVYPIIAEEIFVGIGPGIHKCCYDYSELAAYLYKDKRWQPFITDGPLGFRIDLLDFNIKQLLDAGIKPKHIVAATECTCCTKDESGNYLFFSHRRVLKKKQEKERLERENKIEEAEKIHLETESRFAAVISNF